MQKDTNFKISDLSEHLFWDINKNELVLDKDADFIVQRTLEYGLINDWNIIYNYYGIDEIAKLSLSLVRKCNFTR